MFMHENNESDKRRMQKPYDKYSMHGITFEEESPDIDLESEPEKWRATDVEVHGEQVHRWIDENNYEIENRLNEYQWLSMYADSIRAYNL